VRTSDDARDSLFLCLGQEDASYWRVSGGSSQGESSVSRDEKDDSKVSQPDLPNKSKMK
jgi:hypothetical protein